MVGAKVDCIAVKGTMRLRVSVELQPKKTDGYKRDLLLTRATIDV